jgi:hypothetical protein
MTSLMNRNGLTLAAAFLVTCASLAWLVTARDTTTSSTYAMVAAVLAAMVATAINEWKNGRACVSGQPLLREAHAVGSGQLGLPVSTHERISNASRTR